VNPFGAVGRVSCFSAFFFKSLKFCAETVNVIIANVKDRIIDFIVLFLYLTKDLKY